MLIVCFGYRMWTIPEAKEISRVHGIEGEMLKLVSESCDLKPVSTVIHFLFLSLVQLPITFKQMPQHSKKWRILIR